MRQGHNGKKVAVMRIALTHFGGPRLLQHTVDICFEPQRLRGDERLLGSLIAVGPAAHSSHSCTGLKASSTASIQASTRVMSQSLSLVPSEPGFASDRISKGQTEPLDVSDQGIARELDEFGVSLKCGTNNSVIPNRLELTNFVSVIG